MVKIWHDAAYYWLYKDEWVLEIDGRELGSEGVGRYRDALKYGNVFICTYMYSHSAEDWVEIEKKNG